MQSSRSSTPTCTPKPCLKQLGKVCPTTQKHAHFPPPSEEAQRFSGLDYDRSPIVVLVNECALPARGERVFDDCDEPKVRRHHLHKRSTRSESSDDDERHTGFATLATGASKNLMQSTLMAKSSSAPAAFSMSSVVQADSSDSDDGVALPINSNGVQIYRQALSPDLERNTPSPNSASQSRRLRKSPPNRAHGRSASHDKIRDGSETSFAPWSGSNSCLGGF